MTAGVVCHPECDMMKKKQQVVLSAVGLALGNWVNTPSPDNDPDAPGQVGNCGTLTVKERGGEQIYSVQSAELSSSEDHGVLVVRGESNGEEGFLFAVNLGDDSDLKSTAGKKFLITTSEAPSEHRPFVWLNSLGKRAPITGGTLTVTSVTGSGPWELDAECEFAAGGETVSAFLQARVS